MNGNQIYCADHCTIHSYIVSLYCMSKTNMLYASYISIKKHYIVLNFKWTLQTYLPEKRNLLSIVVNVLSHVPDI